MIVKKVQREGLVFDDGSVLECFHEQSCCEDHYLSFRDLSMEDFEGLEFDLQSEGLVEKVDGYGIRLHPIKGHPISIPGYGVNNGEYSANLVLVIKFADGFVKELDISECQEIEWTYPT